jgi:hypothetical protein
MRAAGPFDVPCIVDGAEVRTGRTQQQRNPGNHEHVLCTYHEADAALTEKAIAGALKAKAQWEVMPWNDRAAIFLKAADLIAGKWRFPLMAATSECRCVCAYTACAHCCARQCWARARTRGRPRLCVCWDDRAQAHADLQHRTRPPSRATSCASVSR